MILIADGMQRAKVRLFELESQMNMYFNIFFFFFVCKLVSTIVAVVGCIHLNS